MTKTSSARHYAGALSAAVLGLSSLSADRLPDYDVRGTAPESIAINDNRSPAGTLHDGTLTIHLEARTGEWHPDADTDPGVVVKAFSVEGGPLQIPGPIIRVVEGTEIRAFVRNGLDVEPLIVHGLYSRPGQSPGPEETVSIPPGAVREIRFMAGKPGTYFYWAATANVRLPQRAAADSQLGGALIVDPRGSVPQPDRVFVIGLWNESLLARDEKVSVIRFVINGKSWPHTERLTYDVGRPVRMRVLNVGFAVHPMHLHGFYFKVDSRGDESRDDVFPPGSSPQMANTERLASGRTFTLTWVPSRGGNWLFHCHDAVHLQKRRSLDGAPVPAPPTHHAVNHALEMMAGPVMGIRVRPAKAEPARRETGERRRLRLVARVDAGGTDSEPAYGYSLEGRRTTPAAPPYLPGPTIVLERDEPVSITVVNRLPEPTAVHWHGIELESYYDGVAGFAGTPGRIAPAIPPGGSFEARFTPPRAGTFIYHTHIDELRQQQAGLTGALLVLDRAASYDPTRDRVFLVTTPRRNPDDDVVLLNGSPTPAAGEMRTGERYRLRFINIHTSRPNLRMRVMAGDKPLTWRAVAKDGMDLPADQATERPSEVQMGNGETFDFEFVPATPGDIRIDVTNGGVGLVLVSMPIRVR